MAYKFQLGSAILSGSTKFEELVEAAGGFKPTVADTAAAVADDSFYFQDSDGSMKRESMADYATAIAGDGLAASSGVLAVGVDDSTIETNSDALRIKDSGVVTAKIADNAVTLAKMAGITRGSLILGDSSGDPSLLAKGTAAQFLQSDGTDPSYVSISGDATVAAGGALTIAADAVEGSMLNDNVISGQTELAHADIASADELMISDGGTLKKVGLDSLRDHYYGQVSGDATVADGGALTIAANAVEDSMVNDNVATGLAGVGLSAASGVLAVDASELSDAAVASGDKFVFQDATDDSTKKESIDDIATFMAGSGLKADAGVLEVRVSGSIVRNSDKIGITGSFAGNGLTYEGGVNSISSIAVNVNSTSFAISSDEVQLASGVAGDGLALGSHALSVNVDDSTLETNSDALRIKDNGVTLAKMAGLARGKFIVGDSSGDPSALALGSAHQFLQSDGTDLAYVSMSGDATLAAGVLSIGATKVTDAMMNDDVATGLAGDGLAAASGVLSVGVDDSTIETNSDALRIKDNGVTLAKMAGLARGKFIIGDSSGDPSALALGSAAQFLVSDGDDLLYRSLSGDATMNAAGVLTIGANAVEGSMLNDNAISGQTDIGGPIAEADELLISDNGSLRRTDVSRLRAMTVAARSDGDTLATGVNYFADLTSDAGVTLPASPQPGDKVIVKAKGLSSAVITISRAGSHTIDGETAVVIESPFGAVTCVYVAVNDWRLI